MTDQDKAPILDEEFDNYDSQYGTGDRKDYKRMWNDKLQKVEADLDRKNPHRVSTAEDRYFQKYYFELDALCDEMQDKVGYVLRKHEMNFLESYRNHMRHITRELDKYKKAINEKEFIGRRDDKLVKIQKSAEWFK